MLNYYHKCFVYLSYYYDEDRHRWERIIEESQEFIWKKMMSRKLKLFCGEILIECAVYLNQNGHKSAFAKFLKAWFLAYILNRSQIAPDLR